MHYIDSNVYCESRVVTDREVATEVNQ